MYLPSKAINNWFFKEHSFGAKITESSKTPFYVKQQCINSHIQFIWTHTYQASHHCKFLGILLKSAQYSAYTFFPGKHFNCLGIHIFHQAVVCSLSCMSHDRTAFHIQMNIICSFRKTGSPINHFIWSSSQEVNPGSCQKLQIQSQQHPRDKSALSKI